MSMPDASELLNAGVLISPRLLRSHARDHACPRGVEYEEQTVVETLCDFLIESESGMCLYMICSFITSLLNK